MPCFFFFLRAGKRNDTLGTVNIESVALHEHAENLSAYQVL